MSGRPRRTRSTESLSTSCSRLRVSSSGAGTQSSSTRLPGSPSSSPTQLSSFSSTQSHKIPTPLGYQDSASVLAGNGERTSWKGELRHGGAAGGCRGEGGGTQTLCPPPQDPEIRSVLSSEASISQPHLAPPPISLPLKLRTWVPSLLSPVSLFYPETKARCLKSKDWGAGARWSLKATLHHSELGTSAEKTSLEHPDGNNISLGPISALCLFVPHRDHSHSPLTGFLTPRVMPHPVLVPTSSHECQRHLSRKQIWPCHGLAEILQRFPNIVINKRHPIYKKWWQL